MVRISVSHIGQFGLECPHRAGKLPQANFGCAEWCLLFARDSARSPASAWRMYASQCFRRRRNTICAMISISLALLWTTSVPAAEPRVLLMRGWFKVFSTGMDSLAEKLRAKGINAEVAGHY